MTSATATAPTTSTWNLDPVHSEFGFSVKHLMVTNVKGQFTDATATIKLDERDYTKSSARIEIDVASVSTRQQQRDDHLRSADFFDAANHPKMVFESRSIERVSADRYRVFGDITIRGTTRPITLVAEVAGPSKDPWGGERIGLNATGNISRSEFGLLWNTVLETGGFAVADDVKLVIDLQLIRA